MLLLFPNLLGPHRQHEMFLSPSVDAAVKTIDGLIAESESGGRRFLSRFALDRKPTDIPIALLNEHTPAGDMDFLLQPVIAGQRWGVVSDAGLPCIADPGANLVFRARQRGIPIQAFVGPSSVMMALMLSGLQGQRFSFHGYLDRDDADGKRRLAQLQEISKKEKSTQTFIEAPYRNQQMLERLLNQLRDTTQFCVAWDLTMPSQAVVCQEVRLWKKSPLPNLDKKPAVFLFLA